jgi:hypothetical protein
MQTAFSIQQLLALPNHTRLVHELLESEAVTTRSALARELCQQLDLRDPKGDWRLATTLKALRDLEAQGFWTLPKAAVAGSGAWNPTRLHQRVQAPTAVPASVEEVRGLQLIEVATEDDLKVWNELMMGEHPLHQCRLVGRQLRYLVASEHGWLGAIGFGSAALYLEDRDEWIGWTASQRMEHLPRVLNMNRFLIRPRVRCENLASHVLGLCVRRVAEDFERRYGLRPWLLESFVDGSRYDGGCYKAANWIRVGQTKGRGRNGRRHEGKSRKDIYLYPLVGDLKDRLGIERSPLVALDVESGLDAPGWAQQEFGDCELGDPRRTRRLVKIVGDQAAQPSGSYSQAAGGNRHDLSTLPRPGAHHQPTKRLRCKASMTCALRRFSGASACLPGARLVLQRHGANGGWLPGAALPASAVHQSAGGRERSRQGHAGVHQRCGHARDVAGELRPERGEGGHWCRSCRHAD